MACDGRFESIRMCIVAAAKAPKQAAANVVHGFSRSISIQKLSPVSVDQNSEYGVNDIIAGRFESADSSKNEASFASQSQLPQGQTNDRLPLSPEAQLAINWHPRETLLAFRVSAGDNFHGSRIGLTQDQHGAPTPTLRSMNVDAVAPHQLACCSFAVPSCPPLSCIPTYPVNIE